ncbi:MAG: hypothetical protein QHH15_04050, partial [Candidatus Thermoplasmatota archaeon]|nr:hypothetical protein [Candidatus Thermoplasmatota archaeon]
MTGTHANIIKSNNFFNINNKIDKDSLLNTNYILKNVDLNYLKPSNKLDYPDYDTGDLDTPLFNFIELMNESKQTAWGLSYADFNYDGNMDFAVTYAD